MTAWQRGLKRTKAMDIRVFSIRNRIEDDEVQLKLISTLKMVADVGTKALDRRQFEFCRDVLNGYALACQVCGQYDCDCGGVGDHARRADGFVIGFLIHHEDGVYGNDVK